MPAGVHNVNRAGDASVPLTKRTAEVRSVNATREIVVALTKCTPTGATAPHFPTQRRCRSRTARHPGASLQRKPSNRYRGKPGAMIR